MERTIERWQSMLRDENALDRAEAEVGRAERELAARETITAEELPRLEDRRAEVEARIARLRAAGLDGTESALARLPRRVPPPGVAGRTAALEARRAALAAREAAQRARAEALEVISGGLAVTAAAFVEVEQEVQRLEALQVEAEAQRLAKAARRQAQGQARAQVAGSAQAGGGRFMAAADGGLTGAIEAALASSDERRTRLEVVPDRDGPPRQSGRRHLECAVDLETHHNFYTGFSANLSGGGLFVATFDLLPVGSECEVSFQLPSGQQLKARAQVRWVRDVLEAGADLWPGMGLQFRELPPGAELAIEQFMESREPLFFPDA